jgi:hypothetical protein
VFIYVQAQQPRGQLQELNNFCSSPDIIIMMKSRKVSCGRLCSTHGEEMN